MDLTGYSYFGRFIIDSRHKGRLPTFMEVQWIDFAQVFSFTFFLLINIITTCTLGLLWNVDEVKFFFFPFTKKKKRSQIFFFLFSVNLNSIFYYFLFITKYHLFLFVDNPSFWNIKYITYIYIICFGGNYRSIKNKK